MSTPIPGIRYVYNGTDFVALGRAPLPGSNVVAGETVAVISAFPEQEAATKAALAELGWTTIWWYAAAGKTVNGADVNGKTTVQNIADARTDITQEPDIWVVDVEQNQAATGATTATTAVLTALGTAARMVVWVGGGYPNAQAGQTFGNTRDSVRAAVEPLVTAHQNAVYAEWRYYNQCHDDTRDKPTGTSNGWWSGTTLTAVGIRHKIHHIYRAHVLAPLTKLHLNWNPTHLAGYTAPTRVGTTYVDITTIPGYAKSKSLKDNLAGLTQQAVVSLPPGAGSGPNGEHEIIDFGIAWMGGIRIGQSGTGGNQLVRGFRGADPDTSKIKLRPWSSTVKSQVPTADGTINPFGVIQVSNVAQFECTNVGFYGSPQGHNYHGLTVGESGSSTPTTDLFINGCKFVGFDKGDDDKPPGESMGVRINNASDVWIMNTEFDGRWEDTGEIASSSMIGFNGPGGSKTNPVNHSQRAHLENIWYHDGYTGMLTFWLYDSATTINFWSDKPGGVLNGTGINHEEAGYGGRPFLHYNPSFIKRGYHEGTYSPHLPLINTTDRGTGHWSMFSGNHDIKNLRVYFIRPDDPGVTHSQLERGVQYKRHDRFASHGTFAGLGFNNGNGYPTGVPNANIPVGSDVLVFKALPGNVVRKLKAVPYSAATNETGDTAVVYYR